MTIPRIKIIALNHPDKSNHYAAQHWEQSINKWYSYLIDSWVTLQEWIATRSRHFDNKPHFMHSILCDHLGHINITETPIIVRFVENNTPGFYLWVFAYNKQKLPFWVIQITLQMYNLFT